MDTNKVSETTDYADRAEEDSGMEIMVIAFLRFLRAQSE
jgi:hypothetical protein